MAKYEDYKASIEEIWQQSDRALVIVSAAVIDELLQQVLGAYFHDDAECQKALIGRDRPLSSLSARIDMAYALNLIERWEWKDLHTIRGIRNDFAHKLDMRNFGDQSIRDRTRNLASFERSQPPFPGTDLRARDLFIISAQLHIGQLLRLTEATRRVNAPLTTAADSAQE